MNKVVFATMCVMLVSAGALVGFLAAFSSLQSGASSSFPEYLVLSEPEYSDTGAWFTMTINNTGIGNVVLVKVLVNDTKQSVTNPSFPFAIAPDHGFMLNVSMYLTQGQMYQIDLYTSQGNKFSKLSQVPTAEHQAGVIIYRANTNFYIQDGTPKIDIDIGDSGTQATQLTALYIGTSVSTLVNQTITPVTFVPDQVKRITVSYNWTNDAVYYFRILTSAGLVLDWVDQAPPEAEQVNMTNMTFTVGDATHGSIQIIANNTGTTAVTINEAWVNNVKVATASENPALPQSIAANAGLQLTITNAVTQGYSYQVKIVSSKGNTFQYTATAPS
jgi:hypothetical protein